VQGAVRGILRGIHNLILTELLSHFYFVRLMSQAYRILTHSGRIQEEASSLGLPVLVLREVTERLEGLLAGGVKLVGIEETAVELLIDSSAYDRMALTVPLWRWPSGPEYCQGDLRNWDYWRRRHFAFAISHRANSGPHGYGR
jgi:UDP-N-acetylglucosamine 2-epimerase